MIKLKCHKFAPMQIIAYKVYLNCIRFLKCYVCHCCIHLSSLRWSLKAPPLLTFEDVFYQSVTPIYLFEKKRPGKKSMPHVVFMYDTPLTFSFECSLSAYPVVSHQRCMQITLWFLRTNFATALAKNGINNGTLLHFSRWRQAKKQGLKANMVTN